MEALFPEILGHARVKEGLVKALAEDRVHHAWLFSGREGVGKGLVAQRFTQLLMCEQGRLGEGTAALAACGRCRHCRRVGEGAHPDLHRVAPEGRSIRIEQVRGLQREVMFKPREARFRVVILERAHALGQEAANALLKTLEEPTQGVLFLLLTDQLHRLLPTIISRCQQVRFAPFGREEVATFLRGRGQDEARASLVSVLAEGSLGRAVEWTQDEVLEARLGLVEAVRRVHAGGVAAAMAVASELPTDRDALGSVFATLRAYYRDLIVLRAGADPSRVGFSWQLEALRAEAAAFELPALLAIIDAINEAQAAIEGYINTQLTLEALLLRVAELRPRGVQPPAARS